MCPKVRDGWCYFISPHSPTGRGLPGKELHAGQIAHQGNDFGAGLVRLFAMGFNRGNDELMNVGSLPLWMSLGRQQADFCIAPCPEAKAVKPAIRLLVLFQPDESNGFIGEAPSLPYSPDGDASLIYGGKIYNPPRFLFNPQYFPEFTWLNSES